LPVQKAGWEEAGEQIKSERLAKDQLRSERLTQNKFKTERPDES